MNCFYDYYIIYLKLKATNNFFSRFIIRLLKKVYKEDKTRYWILVKQTTIHRTFTLIPEHPPMYIKEEAILEIYKELTYLEHYLVKTQE